MLQQLNVVGASCKSTFVLKRKADILRTSCDISIHQWLSNILVDVMLNSWLLLFISRWIMLWNKVVFCLKVFIYKRLQMWRHNDDIGRASDSTCSTAARVTSFRHSFIHSISTLSESTIPYVYSLRFLFKSTHHTWKYERKCEWVFFTEHSV